jgi:hypothetical protein
MNPKLEVRMTASMGRGVFTLQPIATGEVLGRFHTIRFPAEQVRRIAGSLLADYWFEDDGDGSASMALGFIELVNHGSEPNVDRRWERTASGEEVELYALTPIAAGAQLIMDYRFPDGRVPAGWQTEQAVPAAHCVAAGQGGYVFSATLSAKA